MPPASDNVISANVKMRVSFMGSSPCFQCHIYFYIVPVTPDDDGHDIAGFLRAQRVREIVKILNRLSIELDHQIALLQASFCSRAIGLNIREQHALQIISKIGNGSEVRAVAPA